MITANENSADTRHARSYENNRVLLGMSGGLDSTYSVIALRNAGMEVVGATLIMHDGADVASVRETADVLGVPLSVIDLRARFSNEIEKYFVREYTSGRTPNPCVECNRRLKIAALIQEADRLGCGHVATGHYAGIRLLSNGRYCVSRGADPKKDQSYMLWKLTQEQLGRLIFPLGDMFKSDIRIKAGERGLKAAYIKESEDVCFIPDGNTAGFVEDRAGRLPCGDFISSDGKILGRHKGIHNYTVGQRRGLGISSSGRLFVTEIDAKENKVYVGDEKELYFSKIKCGDINFQGIEDDFGGEIRCDVKIRYASPAVSASVTFAGGKATAVFDKPVKAPAPGQSAVFYINNAVALGGVIEERM